MTSTLKMMLTVVTLASISLLTANIYADTGCRRDCEAPTLGLLYTGQQVIDNGLTINGRSFNVAEQTQKIPTTVVKTGDIVNVKLVTYENSGAEYLRLVSLSIGKYSDDKNISKFATVSFQQPFAATLGHPLTGSDVIQTSIVTDPNSMLKDVTVKSTEIDSYRTAVEISFKVTKPLDSSDLIVQTMDAKRNSLTNVFYGGIKVTGKEILQEAPKPIYNPPPTPLQQLKEKISSKNVECRDGYEKITRMSGKINCVSPYTAELLRSMGQAS